MSYNNNHVTRISDLKLAVQNAKRKIDALSSRIDEQVAASTDSDADYAAEVVDARIDEWGNLNTSLGANFRSGQERLQRQINDLAVAQLEILALLAKKEE